jgi:acetolactate synthase-1/3 small subunit
MPDKSDGFGNRRMNEMKKIYSVLVENRSGVLCKVAGLFSRRCFNIDSLAVGETDDSAVSCMTIVSSGDERTIEQIEKQLNKKLDVIKVKTFDESASISRELMLIKIKYNKNNRRDIMENCDIMKAQIVDMSKNMMIIQVCDVPERIQLFISMLQSISIVEVARTGTLALQKCKDMES